MGLLPRIVVAILVGIFCGSLLPEWAVRGLLTFNGIFSELLGYLVPLIILSFVTTAIADVGDKAGRLLAFTVLVAWGMTIGAGLMSMGVADWLFPQLIEVKDYALNDDFIQHKPFFELKIEPLMSVLTALVSAFVLGIGIAYLRPSHALYDVASELRDIVRKTIDVVIVPLLPIYIFGIFVDMVSKGQVAGIISVFAKIIGIIFVLHILLLLLQYLIAGAVAKRNPFRSLWNMMPAYFTALGTQSSAATIPVTLEQAQKNGVSADIAGFVVPLCATIHLAGSMLKIVACAMALMMMQSIPYTTPQMIGFILMLSITMVAAPGVPGGAIMAALGVLEGMLGFDNTDQALMIALYIAMDSFGTAANVTGDGAIALIINRISQNK